MKKPEPISRAVASQVGGEGSHQKRNTNSAVIVMHTTQVRGPRPPKNRSVAQPAATIPTMPAISKAATIQLACTIESPFDSFSRVGPQSSTA